jgi:colicin import membrane protein
MTFSPYTVPKEPGRWRAIILAALVHAALLAFLWIGVHWQSDTPVTIEAEVWDPQVREAAPVPEPVKAPEPVKEPEPQPEAKETPKPKEVEPPVAKPDIALEREKERKAREEKKRHEEEQERFAKQKQKAEEERLAKLEAEKKLQLEKEKTELVKKAAAEKKRKQDEAEAKRKQEEEAAEQKMMAKVREEEMRRITGGVAGSGGTGDAAKSQGNRGDASYAQRVGAKIKSNISFNADDTPGNTAVEYHVDLLPDGSVAGMRMTKSSGVPGFDEAVRRAIEKSQPYPKDKSGNVPSSFIGIHRPKDQ